MKPEQKPDSQSGAAAASSDQFCSSSAYGADGRLYGRSMCLSGCGSLGSRGTSDPICAGGRASTGNPDPAQWVCRSSGVLQRNLLQRLLGELAGSRKDITALHVEQVQALFAAQVGKQSDLPYQMRAEAGYDEIYLKKKNTKNLRNPQRASNHAENTDYTEKISGNIRKTEQKGDGKESGRAIPVQTLDISGMTQQFNGLEITAELLPFDGNFQQIPEKHIRNGLIMIKLKILFR